MPNFSSRASVPASGLIDASRNEPSKRPRPDFQYSVQLRFLLLLVLAFNILADVLDSRQQQLQQSNFHETTSPIANGIARGLLRAVAVVAAADNYSDASAESPSVEAALEDEDEDDEELDGAASNEYPDGDNDNDESYEDADDDRQESRIRENWIAPIQRTGPETNDGHRKVIASPTTHGRFIPMARNRASTLR